MLPLSVRHGDLADLYGSLPTVECRKLCQASCRDMPVVVAERDRLSLPLVMDECPKLTADGACSVYDDRPLMCRLWGVVENMRCPHGCEPSRVLSLAEAREFLVEAERIGGRWLNVPTAD